MKQIPALFLYLIEQVESVEFIDRKNQSIWVYLVLLLRSFGEYWQELQ